METEKSLYNSFIFDLSSPAVHTFVLYKRLAGFVMAYSFSHDDSENAKPTMVPMADILNHVSNNNSHLEFGDKFLSMVTTTEVAKVQISCCIVDSDQ